jgi:hypothetical protein
VGSDGLLKRWDVSKPELPVEKQCWPICAPPPASLAITAHKETRADPFPKVTYLIYIYIYIYIYMVGLNTSRRKKKGYSECCLNWANLPGAPVYLERH